MSGQDKFDEMAHLAFEEWYYAIDDKSSVLQEYDRHTLTRAIAALVRRAAEQARADEREDAEKYRWCINNAAWHRGEECAYVAIPVASDADLSCAAMRDHAISAAIRARGVAPTAGEGGGA